MSDQASDGHPSIGDAPPPIRILTMQEVPEKPAHPPGVEGEQFNRNLLSRALSGTPDIVADLVTFRPGFVHHMHRHPHADQIMLPLRGSLAVFGEDREQHDLTPGQVMVIPRWNWHEARNVTDEPCQVFHFFAGVGDIADIGFELWSEAAVTSRPASTPR